MPQLPPPADADVLVPLYLEDDGECDRCESTGRVDAVAADWDGESYDTSVPCPVCRPTPPREDALP